jgi:predicted DNA-binding protein
MERLDTAMLVRMSTELKAAVEAYAEARHVPAAAAVRELVRAGLESVRRHAV